MVSGFQNCADTLIIYDQYNVPSLGALCASGALLA